MNPMHTGWIRAVESGSALFASIDALVGGSEQFAHSGVLECRNDSAHLLRKLLNLAALHGCPPDALKTAQEHAGVDHE